MAVAAVDRQVFSDVVDAGPLRPFVPWSHPVAFALGGVHIDVGIGLDAGQLAGREVGFDRVERLLERLLVGNLAGHQEAQSFLDPRIVRDVDQPFIDDLRPGLGGDVGAQVAGRFADGVDVGRRPRHARGVGQGRGPAIEDRLGMAVAALVDRHVELGFLEGAFGELALHAPVQHGDDTADDLQVAELLGGDIEQHVLAAGVLLGQGLGEIAHGRGQFALGTSELLEHEAGQGGIGFAHADGVLQSLVVHEHGAAFLDVRRGRCGPASRGNPTRAAFVL